ncbi:MAG: type I-E CRISPR-associated protein Cas7/Cse4/CasC [Planctomycetes bacterium]|nr:type I-E CRISPR-associated protein Cas7/Cse4/CasC [Planctomycetota bacterium]
MSDARFLQFHTLTSYPGALLNRDDAGFAKRLPFGGATRTRVSSQCLKYHWRNYDGEHALYNMDVPRSIRSRRTFKQLVADPLVEEGYPPRIVGCVVKSLKDRILSDDNPSKPDNKKIMNGDMDLEEALETSQVTILGEPEIRYLKQLSRQIMNDLKEEVGLLWTDPDTEPSKEQTDAVHAACKDISKGDLKKNLKGLARATGVDAAMFGRMATSDALARGDAAVHVAHAFTTHAEESESDYFSAVDELKAADAEGELGSGHINTSELNSGLFYGYVVIDVPLLVSNLEGCKRQDWASADRTLAAEVTGRLTHIMATVSPGAKLGSTAPYSWSECVLIEAGTSQPRTLANAFRSPVDKQPDVLQNSYQSLARHISDLDQMYGKNSDRCLAGTGPIDTLAEATGVTSTVSLPDAAEWVAQKVRR